MSEKTARDELISAVQNDLDKSTKESVKGKLKSLLTKKREAEKAVRLVEQEIDDLLSDYEAGRL